MASTQRTYGGRSAEQRRSDRLALLLDVALDVLAESGPDALTVRGVCRRARLADRYFYEHFSSVEELIGAVFDDIIDRRFVPAVTASIVEAGADIAARARAATDVTLGLIEQDPRTGRLLVHAESSKALRTRRDDAIRLGAGLMRASAHELLDRRGPDVDMAALSTAAGLLSLVTWWLRGDVEATRDQLTDFIVAALIASPAAIHVTADQP